MFFCTCITMGAAGAAQILRACDCAGALSDCSKYVLNSCHLHSKCSDCCELEIETEEVSLPEGSDEELEVEGCFRWSRS